MESTTTLKRLFRKEFQFTDKQAGHNSFRKVCQRQCVQVKRKSQILFNQEVMTLQTEIWRKTSNDITILEEKVMMNYTEV